MFTEDQLKAMSLQDAKREIENAVYAATNLIEQLEGVGRVSGNGHHARQKLASSAAQELEARWKGN